MHVSGKELLSLALAIDAAIFDGLLEVLAFLGHDYQGLLVLTKSANLLTGRGHVIFLQGAIT